MTEHKARLIAGDIASLTVSDAGTAQQIAECMRGLGLGEEVVAGLDSVCVQFDPLETPTAQVLKHLQQAASAPPAANRCSAPVIDIQIRYGGEHGPDLAHICEQTGLNESEVIRRHSAAVYKTEMIGFTPGFAYLGSLDPALSVPRLAQPRSVVPAGSVGISAEYSGLYALQGPGGWPIIGRTDHSLFNPNAPDPFVLHPGMKVRFVPIGLP